MRAVSHRIPVYRMMELPVLEELHRMKYTHKGDDPAPFQAIAGRLRGGIRGAPQARSSRINERRIALPAKSGVEYLGLSRVQGPLVFVSGVRNVGFREMAEVVAADGQMRLGTGSRRFRRHGGGGGF